MNGQLPPWRPNPRQATLDWYLTRFLRYIVGPAVIGWELIADNGHNLGILLIGALLAYSGTARDNARELLKMARQERTSLRELLEQAEKDLRRDE